jgi:prepilin-type N-terminal cleavage/methylation domain-containing protein
MTLKRYIPRVFVVTSLFKRSKKISFSGLFFQIFPLGQKKSIKGFTLIEVLVVLGIIATVMGVGVPKINDFYTKYKKKLAIDSFERQLTELPLKAYAKNQDLLVTEEKQLEKWIKLPEESEVSIEKPIHVRRDGVCVAGEIDLIIHEQTFSYELEIPYCKPKLKDLGRRQ